MHFKQGITTGKTPEINSDVASKLYVDEKQQNFINNFSEAFGEPTGFTNRTSSSMSYGSPTRTFSISPVGESFDVYVKNKKYTKTGIETCQWPDTEGGYIFYYSDEGQLCVINRINAGIDIYTDKAMVASLYWNGEDSKVEWFGELRHGHKMSGMTHFFINQFICTQYNFGLDINITCNQNGSQDSHCYVEHSLGAITDEDIVIGIPSSGSPWNGKLFYKEGINSLWRTVNFTGAPLKIGISRPVINNFNEETGWCLQEVDSGKYFWVHLYASGNLESPVVALMGINQYNKSKELEVGLGTEIKIVETDGSLMPGLKSIGSVAYEVGNFSNSFKSRIVSVKIDGKIENYADTRHARMVTTVTPNSHGLLHGLMYDHHLQYLNTNGRETGQTLVGSSDETGGLTLESSKNVSKRTLALTDTDISTDASYTPQNDKSLATKQYVDLKVHSTSVDFTITDENVVICTAHDADITNITLPVESGKYITVKQTDMTPVSIVTQNSQNIDGSPSYNLASIGSKVTLIFDGSNWHSINAF